MYTRKLRGVAAMLAVAFGSTAAFAQSPKLGKPISAAEVAAWDISVLPDGTGLPPGSTGRTQRASGPQLGSMVSSTTGAAVLACGRRGTYRLSTAEAGETRALNLC